MSENASILLIEDDVKMALGVQFNLNMEGYKIDLADTGEKAVRLLEKNEYDLIITDIMLPGISGLDIMKRFRTTNTVTPILVLSAKNSSGDIVHGLQEGADDYMTKPFDLNILLAKVDSLIRGRKWLIQKSSSTEEPNEVVFGKNRINFQNSTAQRGNKEFRLSYKETMIMRMLCENEGQVISRETFMKQVWGTDKYIQSRSLDNFILQLRKYFEDNPKAPKYILKVHGEGYRFVRPSE